MSSLGVNFFSNFNKMAILKKKKLIIIIKWPNYNFLVLINLSQF